MPVDVDKKRSSSLSSSGGKRRQLKTGAGSEKRESLRDAGAGDANVLSSVAVLPQPIAYLGGKQRTGHRQAKYQQRFAELSKMICSSNATLRSFGAAEAAGTTVTSVSASGTDASFTASSSLLVVHAFPVLSVGYVARAMGLNVSNQQVAALIELIEEGGPSAGFVDKRRLELVLVNALMTGTLGGPTLRESSRQLVSSTMDVEAHRVFMNRLADFAPSRCVRDDEATIFRAFEALDTEHKGYLEKSELRKAMTSEGECFSNEEAEEMWLEMRDPEMDCVYYRDFADILSRE